MVHDRVPVAADVAAGHVAGVVGVLVAEGPAGDDRSRRLAGGVRRRRMALLPGSAVVGQVALHFVPGLLRDDQHPHAQLGHDAAALRRDGGGVGAIPEAAEGVGADFPTGLLDVLAVKLAEAAFQAGQQALGGLDKTGAGLVHIDAKTVVLHLGQAAAHAQDETARR